MKDKVYFWVVRPTPQINYHKKNLLDKEHWIAVDVIKLC